MREESFRIKTRRKKMRNKIIMAVISAAALMLSGQAMAARQTANMTVSLTNIAVATISTTPIAFGNVTAASAGNATGTITVNVSTGITYKIAIDRGLHAPLGFMMTPCRQMTGAGGISRTYNTYSDPGLTTTWGDNDGAGGGVCAIGLNGPSVSGTGTGANEVRTVYAKADAGTGTGTVTDTLTVTVIY